MVTAIVIHNREPEALRWGEASVWVAGRVEDSQPALLLLHQRL